jgi:hypothetical protein
MAVDPALLEPLEALTGHELQAITAAAAWYAKYHERMISDAADDGSAAATVRREEFEHLHSALRKLGIRIRRPDGL